MTVEEYLTKTPENTNPNILRSSFLVSDGFIAQIMKDPVRQNYNVWKDIFPSSASFPTISDLDFK